MLAKTGRVFKPYSGDILDDLPYLHFDQPFVTNGTVEIAGKQYPYGKLYSNTLSLPNFFDTFPANTDCTNYTFFIRFRDDSKVNDIQIEHQLAAIGFSWTYGSTGAGRGLALSIVTGKNNKSWIPKLYLGRVGREYYDSGNYFEPGHWCEVAVRVAGRNVSLYTCSNFLEEPVTNKNLYVQSETITGTSDPRIMPDQHWARIGGEQSGAVCYTNGVNGTHEQTGIANIVKAFRGDIQQVAFWTRALSDKEIREVFAERRPALIRAGFANGSSDEFTKEQDALDAAAPRPETWNPVLNAEHPMKTLTFTIADGEQAVSRYLRVRPVSGSAPATVAVALDGTGLSSLVLADEEDAYCYVRAALLTKGSHTLTLTRTDANGGDCTIDALALAGSWRFGQADAGEHGGFSHESATYVYKNPRIYYPTDGNMIHYARGLTNSGTDDNANHYYPFDIPAALVGKMRDATLTLQFGVAGTWPQQLAISLNGTVITNMTATKNSVESKNVVMRVPSSAFQAGENTLKINKSTSGWINVWGTYLSLGRLATGSLLIVR